MGVPNLPLIRTNKQQLRIKPISEMAWLGDSLNLKGFKFFLVNNLLIFPNYGGYYKQLHSFSYSLNKYFNKSDKNFID